MLEGLPSYAPRLAKDHISISGCNDISLPYSRVEALIAHPELFSVWWFMQDRDRLQEEERVHLNALFVDNQELEELYRLTQAFQSLLSQRAPERLDGGLIQAESCGIKKLQKFALTLREDYAAVRAALSYEWSNGQVEGQVNRLRSIKHQMYGRANFDLLRQRVLGPPS
jgi:transposase